MTWYTVHNPGEFYSERQLFGFAEQASMDPPVTLIWASSFEAAYEVYVGDVAWSYTEEEAQEEFSHLDWTEDTPDYFDFNYEGKLVYTELITGWEIERDTPTYLMAVIVTAHDTAEVPVFAVTFADEGEARLTQRRLERRDIDSTLTEWDFFSGRERDLESITGGRLKSTTRWIIWYVPDEYEDEPEEGAEAFLVAALAAGKAKGAEILETLDYAEKGFRVPPKRGAALFYFPGTEEELEELDIEGVDPLFLPLEDRTGAGYNYVWTRDPTISLREEPGVGPGRGPGIVREISVDFDDIESFLVVQDQLMLAGVQGFMAVWPTPDGGVWKPHTWQLLQGEEEIEKAKRFVIHPDPRKLGYVLQNPGQTRKLKNRLLR